MSISLDLNCTYQQLSSAMLVANQGVRTYQKKMSLINSLSVVGVVSAVTAAIFVSMGLAATAALATLALKIISPNLIESYLDKKAEFMSVVQPLMQTKTTNHFGNMLVIKVEGRYFHLVTNRDDLLSLEDQTNNIRN